jgi:AcrR family transcriptional regulator
MVDAILDAAAAVLRKDGYDETTTNRVAEVAGVSVGSLYQYFPNKQALVTALIERHEAAMWAAFTTHATGALGRPFAEVVHAVIDALFAAHLVDPALHAVLHQHIPRIGAIPTLAATTLRARALVEDILRVRVGQLGEVDDVPMAALVIVETVEALIHAAHTLPRARAETLRVHAARLVLRYLGVPTP